MKNLYLIILFCFFIIISSFKLFSQVQKEGTIIKQSGAIETGNRIMINEYTFIDMGGHTRDGDKIYWCTDELPISVIWGDVTGDARSVFYGDLPASIAGDPKYDIVTKIFGANKYALKVFQLPTADQVRQLLYDADKRLAKVQYDDSKFLEDIIVLKSKINGNEILIPAPSANSFDSYYYWTGDRDASRSGYALAAYFQINNKSVKSGCEGVRSINKLKVRPILIVKDVDNSNKKNSNNNVYNNHEYVDLGLPSGTLWATMNVGSIRPEDYGDYFAWGEVIPKENCDWNTYKWYDPFSYGITKYCTDRNHGKVDNQIELDLTDDAAHVNWGEGWQMPSKKQLMELINECAWEIRTINNVKGYIVHSKHNNSSIFLPLAGYRAGYIAGCGDAKPIKPESCGGYWSRDLDTKDLSNPSCGVFLQLGLDEHNVYRAGRSYGHNVRPVRTSR